MSHKTYSLIGAVLLATLASSVGCSKESSTGPADDPEIVTVISSATIGTTTAAVRNGTPPTDAGAPTLTVAGAATIIPGGGSQFDITGSAPFSVLYVFVQGRPGYYEITLPASVTSVSVVVTIGVTLSGNGYTFEFAAGRGSGAGTRQTRPITVQTAGTTGVQVSVSWNSAADVDLYLVEPSGNTIYYGNRQSASGGTLDLDANAGCGQDAVRNENINWPTGNPPTGTYTVRVNYWSNCGVPATDWVVTVRVPRQPVRTFTGRFTGDGEGGGVNAGQVVTTFNVTGTSLRIADALAAPVAPATPFPMTAFKLGAR